MKLIFAIINNDDSAIAASALNNAGFMVTKLATTGGFLMVGNTTLLIVTEEDKIGKVRDVLKQTCSERKQINPSSSSYGRGILSDSLGDEVVVGGATMIVMNVENYEKI